MSLIIFKLEMVTTRLGEQVTTGRRICKKKKVKEGFVTEKDQFVDRKKAAKIAKKAGEIKKKIKKLHTTDLREGLKVKKKVLK